MKLPGICKQIINVSWYLLRINVFLLWKWILSNSILALCALWKLNTFLVLKFIYTLEGYMFLLTSSENTSVGYKFRFNFFHLLKTTGEEIRRGCCNHREIGWKVTQRRWSAKQKRIKLKCYAGRKWRFSGQNI